VSAAVVTLTERQRQVLVLAARGLTDSEIAAELFVHVGTAKFALRSARVYLGAPDRTSAVALALVHGLITREDVLGGKP
jgi:DNA-binding CsgD family transcriptional regulator